MTLAHHMALKVSHCSKGKGIWFVWVPTGKKYIYNFLRIHKMKWDHKKKKITDTTSMASKWGTWILEWDLKIQKGKSQKRKKPPISWFPDLRLLFPEWQQFSYQHYKFPLLLRCSLWFQIRIHYNMLVKGSNDPGPQC